MSVLDIGGLGMFELVCNRCHFGFQGNQISQWFFISSYGREKFGENYVQKKLLCIV
jgi:hypothetical protein